MATAEQLKALIRSYGESDSDHFYSVALQIAAHAARQGKNSFAVELKELVESVKKRSSLQTPGNIVPLARPTGELSALLTASYPTTRITEMVLPASIVSILNRLILEFRQKNKLASHGLRHSRKLLLVGPPGCGKTMTARALAGELKLPLLSVQLHSLITKFMGETAAKLFNIFQSMTSTRGVYLFDEFDALGTQRHSSNDVAEMRRVLNSFLQFLENDESDSLVIAATNHADILDRALFRRFDTMIKYKLPSPSEAIKLIENKLARFGVEDISEKTLKPLFKGLSHAEIASVCDEAAKSLILSGKKQLDISIIKSALITRKDLGDNS